MLKPERIKEIAKWYLRDVDTNSNPINNAQNEKITGDNVVTFKDTKTINVT
nr:hypothetical protein [uncultured Haemophilus sp.]